MVSAVERDPQAAATYALNHDDYGVVTVPKDVTSVSGTELLGRRKYVDLVAAGPPCTGFSIKGQRRSDHPSNPMLQEVVRLVDELRPRAVLIENVIGLTSMDRGFYFDRLITGLERLDLGEGRRYDVDYSVLNAAEYGSPQTRRRLFIVAMEPGRRWEWPTPTSTIGDVTLWDAIADLPAKAVVPGALTTYRPNVVPSAYADALRNGTEKVLNHHTKRLEETRRKRLRALKPGQDRRHLPEELRAGGHESKYRRLRADKPAPTLVAHMGKDLSDFIHPKLQRSLTAREAARIQGFPDEYEFMGSQASQLAQVGNAVPVHLARSLGEALIDVLQRRRRG